MEKISVERLVKGVRVILEQNLSPAELVGVGDARALSLDALIERNLVGAVDAVVGFCNEGKIRNADEAVYLAETGSTLDKVVMPAGMARFLYIDADGWEDVVNAVGEKGSPEWRIAKNKFVNILGVKARPAAFRIYDNVTNRESVEIYPASGEVRIKYVKQAEIDEDENGDRVIGCDEELASAVENFAAYLTCMVQGWENASGYLQESMRLAGAQVQQAAVAQETGGEA